MHEYSLAENIVNIATRVMLEHGGKIIKEIELEIGTAAGVETEALLFALQVISQKSFSNAVAIKVETITAQGFCNTCSASYAMADIYSACPSCSAYNGLPKTGRELKVKSVVFD